MDIGKQVLLNMKGVNHVKDTFGSLSGIEEPWTITGKSMSSLAPTYTLLNDRGIRFEGVREDYLLPAPLIDS